MIFDEGSLYGAIMFDEAAELVGKLMTENDSDILADVMDHIVQSSDLSHACLFLLLARARPDLASATEATGVELVGTKPIQQIIIPDWVKGR